MPGTSRDNLQPLFRYIGNMGDLAISEIEWQALRISFAVALRSALFSLPFAIAVAWVLTRRRFFGRFMLDALVHLPLVLPPVLIGYGLLLLFGVRGPVGAWLQQSLGIRLVFTLQGAALATAVMTFPLMVRAIRIALEHVDTGLEDAARTLGAHAFDRFISITLPLMSPGILAGTITAFVAALGEFGAVITFAGNVPGETQTLPLALYSALQRPDGDVLAGRLALLSLCLGLGGLALAELASRLLRRRLGRPGHT
jgi:molybdate transport system permease protein